MKRLLGVVALASAALVMAPTPVDAVGASTPAQICNVIRAQEDRTGVNVLTAVAYGWFDYNGNVAKECGARPPPAQSPDGPSDSDTGADDSEPGAEPPSEG